MLASFPGLHPAPKGPGDEGTHTCVYIQHAVIMLLYVIIVDTSISFLHRRLMYAYIVIIIFL